MNLDEDKFFAKVFGAFAGIWVLSVLLGLAVLGVAVWAVIRLVLHFT